MRIGNQEAVAEAKACAMAVYNSPGYAPLRAHIPANMNDATLQQLSDPALAEPEEVAAIYSTHPHAQECRKALLQKLATTEPAVVPILVTTFNKNEDDVLALTQRKLPWGDYVKRVRDHLADAAAQIQSADREVVNELKQENAAEIAQRQRAAEALAAFAQTQEIINAANRPVFTNCTGFGNSVNCISH